MKFFNTLTRNNEDFKPINANKIGIYSCGLTVYSHPHIGNWVAYIYWDILVRTLRASGYHVTHVQNITDVGHLTSDEDAGEDKMLKSALKEGKTAWEVAEKYINIANDEAYNKLGLVRPAHMPRATEYIPQQIAFVEELEKKGFTYAIDDGVYFDTSKLSDYGKLARLDINGLQFGARVEATGKKNPTDFALWKFSPKNQKRDMEWDSPWGKGFPGWHLECSVMVRELLGDTIDIHTGGIDHIPVHHTNEIAQSEAHNTKPLAHTWLHANHIKVGGTKMSKSLGNIYTLQDITDRGFDLRSFKILILSKHYQTEGNFTWEILEAAQNRLKNWLSAIDLLWQEDKAVDTAMTGHDFHEQLLARLQHNLDTPAALSLIDTTLDIVQNQHFCKPCIEGIANAVNDLLGINLLADRSDVTSQQKELIAQRDFARKNNDWTKADAIRDGLLKEGLALRDTPKGTVWSRDI